MCQKNQLHHHDETTFKIKDKRACDGTAIKNAGSMLPGKCVLFHVGGKTQCKAENLENQQCGDFQRTHAFLRGAAVARKQKNFIYCPVLRPLCHLKNKFWFLALHLAKKSLKIS